MLRSFVDFIGNRKDELDRNFWVDNSCGCSKNAWNPMINSNG